MPPRCYVFMEISLLSSFRGWDVSWQQLVLLCLLNIKFSHEGKLRWVDSFILLKWEELNGGSFINCEEWLRMLVRLWNDKFLCIYYVSVVFLMVILREGKKFICSWAIKHWGRKIPKRSAFYHCIYLLFNCHARFHKNTRLPKHQIWCLKESQ